MLAKKILKKIVLGRKYSSETYISFLKSAGAVIGEDVIIYCPSKTLIDETQPWLISIGNHVRITDEVTILTHDYAWSVFKCQENGKFEGAILGSNRPTTIGNNVFIGMKSIITAGVSIGDNVIIGAGSIVTNNVEANSVYCGNPARKIMDLDEYMNKRALAQDREAKELAVKYFSRYKVKPNKEIFHEYFGVFSNSTDINMNRVFYDKLKLGNNIDKSIKYYNEKSPLYDSYDSFLKECGIK